ncbi:EF-P lysine aminoacylase GenX [Bdellovibrio bacteriovorus]|uniref:EF-P lysine aminoacylase GenX n=2 Tax=Bdellovibrio bacteriovorus TaxID=959 RepID=A0A150WSN6_BDEBC|nr:EF-P lysine aminoacylase GenX [Bdellovibrio bacteriovorus]
MPSEVKVAGRIYKIEREEGLKLQLIRDEKIHKVSFQIAPPHSEHLIEGDLVAVTSAEEIVLLSPQLTALPLRHFDKVFLQEWSAYLNQIREFFKKKEFVEVKTPSLVRCPGTEPSLDVFTTLLVQGSRQERLYLPTSPELHLKKALALGGEKIFELAPCFRNGEITQRHQPEFLMLEWYRAYEALPAIKDDVVALIGHMVKFLNVAAPVSVHTYSVAELFKIYCDFDFTPQTSAIDLKNLADRLEVDVQSAESIDDLFFLIFMEKIESQLPPEDLVFVEKYPPYQAALARLTEDGWGDRFEAYWKGLELANAFNELNDPYVQRHRAQEDLNKKKESHREPVSLDEEFFRCLEAGMPPSAGIALGVERLYMALKGISDIEDLRLFPQLNLRW